MLVCHHQKRGNCWDMRCHYNSTASVLEQIRNRLGTQWGTHEVLISEHKDIGTDPQDIGPEKKAERRIQLRGTSYHKRRTS